MNPEISTPSRKGHFSLERVRPFGRMLTLTYQDDTSDEFDLGRDDVQDLLSRKLNVAWETAEFLSSYATGFYTVHFKLRKAKYTGLMELDDVYVP